MPGPPFRGILSPPDEVDDVDREIGQVAAELRREVVAAALDEQELGVKLAQSRWSSANEVRRDVVWRIAVCGQPPVSTA